MLKKNQNYYIVFAKENDKSWMTKVATLTFPQFLNVCETRKDLITEWVNAGFCALYLKLGDKEFEKLNGTKCICFLCPTKTTFSQLSDDDFTFINKYTGFNRPFATGTITSDIINLLRQAKAEADNQKVSNL